LPAFEESDAYSITADYSYQDDADDSNVGELKFEGFHGHQ